MDVQYKTPDHRVVSFETYPTRPAQDDVLSKTILIMGLTILSILGDPRFGKPQNSPTPPNQQPSVFLADSNQKGLDSVK